ncbi:LysR family transcriptional regulator [Chromobacterium phragmitis]|uniref:LysR family transcriptional regulator n=2 Tax=Chromobacterium amazonense TaxID=1382803 RepID=UPI0021B7715D|nr:LysR family transcriptional regulator [Chromobacterium amazonense]MBM2883797.1 LysR family transcriptional regulator [Chromobacterium amazonense]
MDIRQLKAFVAVFEERSITLAAQRLFVTQPTLSVTIRQLEEELGTALFERLPRGVAVSEHARLLYPQARRMLAQADALSRMFRQTRDCLPLRVGIDPDISRSQLESLLARIAAAKPGILAEVVEGCDGDVRLAAEDGRCEDELFQPLWEEDFVLAVPPGHALAACAEADPALLDEPDWIICPGHPCNQRLLDLHAAAAPSLAAAARAGSLRLAAHMAAAGMGVALLPASLAADHPGLRAVALAGARPRRRVGLCYPAQALELPALQALRENLEAYSGSGAARP